MAVGPTFMETQEGRETPRALDGYMLAMLSHVLFQVCAHPQCAEGTPY